MIGLKMATAARDLRQSLRQCSLPSIRKGDAWLDIRPVFKTPK
jgi:hypothetical protein